MAELSNEEMLASVQTETPTSEAAPTEAPAAAPQPAPGPWWAEKLKEQVEYTTEGGKKVNEPLELILKRAGMGYNYAQKAHLLNSQQEHYKSLEQRIQELSKWNEFDEYAKKNPEWAKHVDESWSKRDAFGNQQQANPEVEALKQKLAELESVANEFKTEKQKIQQSQEDKVMASEISEVAKKFNVDLEQADENGSSLEWRVLEHMKNMGLDGRKGHFTAAFKDYYFENLVQMQKEQAQEAQVKQKSELSQAGIRGISSTPKQTGALNGKDLSRLPWNQLGDLALNEIMSNQKN